jgi:hypothetical protein
VPDSVIERMRAADERGDASAEGLAIAREVTREIRHLVQGLQISTTSGAMEGVRGVIDAARG